MSANVQMTGKEATVVYTDLDTGRILGFGVENAPPPRTVRGLKWKSETIIHARDLDRWADKYRAQYIRDAEVQSVMKLEQERDFRKAMRDAVLDRNRHLDAFNQSVNLKMLAEQDRVYEAILTSRRRAEVCIAAEKYEAGGNEARVALDSPFIKDANAHS